MVCFKMTIAAYRRERDHLPPVNGEPTPDMDGERDWYVCFDDWLYSHLGEWRPPADWMLVKDERP